MEKAKSFLMEIVRTAPRTILQINAGDLLEFAGEIVGGVIDALKEADSKRGANEMLTIGEVARLLKVSKMTLHRWDKNGILKKVNMGGMIRYRRLDIEAITKNRKEE